MKKALIRFVHRLADGAIARLMPMVLRHYNSVYSERWHPHHALRREALAETVAYIRHNMPDAMIKEDEFGVLSYGASRAELDGLFLEFGVRTGTTVNHIAGERPGNIVYGFDSFEGLPEEWSGWMQEKGVFAMSRLPKVRDNVRLVVGRFDQTLAQFLDEHQDDAAFIHIDSDLYSSARTVLQGLANRIKAGTVIVFNEYFNYPNWQRHEFRAFQEFCAEHEVSYDYLCWGKFEVAVIIRSAVSERGSTK